MTGSSTGKAFSVTTFGESHGVALGVIIDGCPPGMQLSEADIQPHLDRRRPGRTAHVTPRNEGDKVEILSGVFEGLTTGTPIALMIRNENARSGDYDKLRQVFRPGHADYGYHVKYGVVDHRGGGRASARETAMRVAAGAVASKYLSENAGVTVRACVDQVGPIIAGTTGWDWDFVGQNDFFFPDATKLKELTGLLEELRGQGDSVGAGIRLECINVPPGLGEPVFDKLDADLAKAMISINAVKGVEFGDGFGVVDSRGSSSRDAIMALDQTQNVTNKSGGILGGISTGAAIDLRVALKPTSSVRSNIQTVNAEGEQVDLSVRGRHDPCVGLRAVPIVEAMASLTIMEHLMRQRAQNPTWLQNATTDGDSKAGVT